MANASEDTGKCPNAVNEMRRNKNCEFILTNKRIFLIARAVIDREAGRRDRAGMRQIYQDIKLVIRLPATIQSRNI